MKSNIINNYKPDIDSFYKNFYNINFENISDNDMMRFKEISKPINKFYEYKNTPYTKLKKYIMLMNKIKTNPKGFGVTNELEKYIFFMYSVDPNLDAIVIHESYNNSKEIKTNLEKRFGIYDNKLILIERNFVKYILSPKDKKEIQDRIDDAIYR